MGTRSSGARCSALIGLGAVLALVGACGVEPEPDRQSGGESTAEPTVTVESVELDPRLSALYDELLTMDETDQQTLGSPEPPPGRSPQVTADLAGMLYANALDSLNNPQWWDSTDDPLTRTQQIIRTYPQDIAEFLETVETVKTGRLAVFAASTFAPETQPNGPPRIVKAVWRTEQSAVEPTEQLVFLKIYAVYEFGEPGDYAPILLTREFLAVSRDDDGGRMLEISGTLLGVHQRTADCEGVLKALTVEELQDVATEEFIGWVTEYADSVRTPGWTDESEGTTSPWVDDPTACDSA